MKSRVINTKNFEWNKENKQFIGYTSKLKPSLFYGNKEREGYIWLQSQWTNKMSKWILQNETMKDNQIEKWEFVPDNKFVEKFPNLKDYILIVNFDSHYKFGKAAKQRNDELNRKRKMNK